MGITNKGGSLFSKTYDLCSIQGPDAFQIRVAGPEAISHSRAVERGTVMEPQDYQRGVHEVVTEIFSWLQLSAGRNVLWMSTVAQKMWANPWLVQHFDHRNNFFNVLYNQIALRECKNITGYTSWTSSM